MLAEHTGRPVITYRAECESEALHNKLGFFFLFFYDSAVELLCQFYHICLLFQKLVKIGQHMSGMCLTVINF